MSSKTTDDDDTEKRTVIQNDDLGSRQVALESIDGASTAVEIPPEAYEDDTIGVKAFAFDDEPGQVELYFGQEIKIVQTFEAADAREFADRIARAAEEADTEIGGEA